jgi:hypothetical protein
MRGLDISDTRDKLLLYTKSGLLGSAGSSMSLLTGAEPEEPAVKPKDKK